MNAVNWLLIHGGNAAHGLWGALVALFQTVWEALDAVLNPVLSRLLALLNPPCTVLGDAVYAILSPFPIWLGLTCLSVIAGVLMLVVFRYTSNQAAIARARDDITANLLALKLFKDELRVALWSQRRVFGALGRLQWHLLRPLCILLLPMLLVVGQMGVRYQWRPLRPGERTLIKLRLNSADADPPTVQLEPNPGVVAEVGPVPGGGVLVWRIRGGEPGRHTLRFTVGDTFVEKELVVGDSFQRVSAERLGRRWTSQILHPAEPLLPSDSPVESIEILYGGRKSRLYGASYWLLSFFVVSMASALLLKPLFKVRF